MATVRYNTPEVRVKPPSYVGVSGSHAVNEKPRWTYEACCEAHGCVEEFVAMLLLGLVSRARERQWRRGKVFGAL
jgi:hypothetical protein